MATAAYIEEGARSWFLDPKRNLWQPCAAGKVDGEGNQTFVSDDGESYTIHGSQINPTCCSIMHRTSVESVQDMATLGDLHEGAILYNIKQRYLKNEIYTYIGSILAAVNPFKKLGPLYTDEMILKYKGVPIGELPPHVFAIANEAYANMWKSDRDQVVLISGESGAGKTESTKFMLRFLSYLSNEVSSAAGNAVKGAKSFEEQILQSNPVLEAFGNAKTVYNNNSSRFGKFMTVNFNNNGVIEGGKIIDYLLEKNRVVRQNTNERSFHMFYCVVTTPQDPKLKLTSEPTNYHYLNQSGVTAVDGMDDKEDFQRILAAFTELNFSEEQRSNVMMVVAVILHLGNVQFESKGGAQIKDRGIVTLIATLLDIDEEALAEGMVEKKRELRGEVIATPLDQQQAADSRDSMAMAIYACLFKFLVKKINITLKGKESFHNIGILDIFGFENFEENFLEQFNINYANEKLQQYFNRHIFSLEQIEYTKEGLEWKDIDYVDNAECLDLIERKLGIISLIDEESRMPRGTDESVKNKLHNGHAKHAYYIKPRVLNNLFGIQHYAGAVSYDLTRIVEKNRDLFREDMLDVLQNSQNDFVFDLFETLGGAKAQKGGTSRRKTTLCVQFKDSLGQLMKLLGMANPFFVRCVKPNMEKQADNFNVDTVMNQLRYSGMMETVKIRRAGYPVRRAFDDFLFRFRVLASGVDKSLPLKDQCSAVFSKHEPTGKDWKMGHTKAFMREKVEVVLEEARQKELQVTIEKIKAFVAAVVLQQRMKTIKVSIVRIQAWYKSIYYRKIFLNDRRRVIVAQTHYRGYIARKRYVDMLQEKRLEEEEKREEERRYEEDRLAEMARVEEEARIEAIKRVEEIRKAEEAAALAATKSAEEAAKAKQALEEAKAKAKAETEAAEAAALKAKEEDEVRAKAKLEGEEKAKAAELDAIKDAKEKAEALQVQQAANAEAKEQDEEKAKLDKAMEKKQLAMQVEAADRREEEMQFEGGEGDVDEDEEAESNVVDEEFGDEDEFDDDDEDDYKDGFLGMFKGMLKNLKKRWCVLHNGTFMWFKSQQNFIKSGWLHKQGGGSSTFGKKSWKRRWMTLKGGELHYHESEDDEAKVLGIVDIQTCEGVDTNGVPIKKEFAFAIHASHPKKRTYLMHAESQDDLDSWVEALNAVKGQSDDTIREMLMSAQVDPRNAQATIDLDEIMSVTPMEEKDSANHPIFVVMCANRVEKFIAADKDDMDDWLRVLAPKKGKGSADDDVTLQGYMTKSGGDKGLSQKRFFILRGEVINYYKTPNDPNSLKGTIPLNQLCSVVQPEEKLPNEQQRDWTFVVHSRRKSFELSCKTQAECNRWVNAIQDVIDNAPDIETPTEGLMDQLKMAVPAEWDAIYRTNQILCFKNQPLKAPLLPLPYGEKTQASGRAYETLQEEALMVNEALLPEMKSAKLPGQVKYGHPGQPVKLIKNIVQACFDVAKLRNEVYCQVIKMTTMFPEPCSPLNMVHWHLLGALCCTVPASRKYLRFLRFHLRRTTELGDLSGDEVVAAANFCLEALKKPKTRDFPPSTEEIKGIMQGTGLICKVSCVGGETHDVPIQSNSSVADVITQIKVKLKLTNCANGFGLFESCGMVDKYLEDKVIIADTLSKWEKYQAHGINPDGGTWTFVFKLFSFYDPLNANLSSVEQEFLFEQAFESVLHRKYPATAKELVELAAYRTQFVVGDYEDGDYISDLVKVHPAQQPQLISGNSSSGGTIVGTLMKKMKSKTLRGFGKGTLKKLKGDATLRHGEEVDPALLKKIKEDICKSWKKFKGVTRDDARKQFMEIIHSWNGYGANLFDVEQDAKHLSGPMKDWPKELWLAISLEGVGVFPRGERKCLAFYRYETVLSFGAPLANKYKIMIDGVGSMVFDTSMVLEIAKLMKEYIKTIVTRRA